MPRCGATTVLSASPTPSPRGMAIIATTAPSSTAFNGTWASSPATRHGRMRIRCGTGRSAVQGIMLTSTATAARCDGVLELSDHIHAMRGKKPVRAMVNANCYSTAYATASAADNITVTPSGGAGSIGVVTMHVDCYPHWRRPASGVLHLRRQATRVDGNPYEPLPDGVRADIQTPHRRHLPEVRVRPWPGTGASAKQQSAPPRRAATPPTMPRPRDRSTLVAAPPRRRSPDSPTSFPAHPSGVR